MFCWKKALKYISAIIAIIPVLAIYLLSTSYQWVPELVLHFNTYNLFLPRSLDPTSLNPIRTERFRLPLDWGGADCALRRFEASGDFISCLNQSNMVSNDTLGLYLPAETLKPILCCILCPWRGTEVISSDCKKFVAENLTFSHFGLIWTICISNESWDHSEFKSDIRSYDLLL